MMPKPRGYADPKLKRVTFNITLDGRMYAVLEQLAEQRKISVREYVMEEVLVYASDHKKAVQMPAEHYTARHDDEIVVD